eukprot:scaffold32690_cov65-Phaeocystis_antarctica.AAC.7
MGAASRWPRGIVSSGSTRAEATRSRSPATVREPACNALASSAPWRVNAAHACTTASALGTAAHRLLH